MSDIIEYSSVEDAVDFVFDLLTEDAGYIGRSNKPYRRYAPAAHLLELLAWNIVVAFWVNVAASYFHYYFIQQTHKKILQQRELLEHRVLRLQKELSSTREKLAEKEACLQVLQDTNQLLKSLKASPISIQSVHPNSFEIEGLLVSWGWPRSEAKIKSKAIMKKIGKAEGESSE